jgi:inner membrane protein
MEKKNLFNQSGNRIPLKIIVGLIIVILLLIPVQMIESLIIERSNYHDNVERTISKDWGTDQTVKGPFLIVPFKDPKFGNIIKYYNQNGVQKRSKQEVSIVFTPDILKITTVTKPTFKHRGIYKYVVYTSNIQINGDFGEFDISDIKLHNRQIKYNDLDFENAKLQFDISDVKGISGDSKIIWNDTLSKLKPINTSQNSGKEGFYCDANISSVTKHKFKVNIKLKGSQSLHFIPIGKLTKVNMNTEWESPKFVGNYSPDSSSYDGKNYSAVWSISNLARPIPNSWLTNQHPSLSNFNLGVEMIEPVDKYQQTLRSAKYSILFIILSFLVIFFSEFTSKKPTNILQYILTGFALILFYSLLLSLTEQMSFALAYLISAGAIIGLVSIYSHSIFKNFKTTSIMFTFWAVLYSFLYFVLQLEDLALLAGNIGLFIILAFVMYFSRKLSNSNTPSEPKTIVENDNGDLL